MHEKAKALDADAIILDLEDAVGEAHKAEARTTLGESLERLSPFSCRVLLRINHVATPHYQQDVQLAAELAEAGRIHGIVLPKVESATEVTDVANAVPIPLWANIETPKAVLGLSSIMEGAPSLLGIIAGINDLSAALQLPQTESWQPRSGLHHALSHMVLCARAHGKWAVDGVYNRIADLDGLEGECREGRELGFDGKSLIHPSHIEITNRAYSPTKAELEAAKALLQAYDNSEGGAVRHGGQMVEALHVERARNMVRFFGNS